MSESHSLVRVMVLDTEHDCLHLKKLFAAGLQSKRSLGMVEPLSVGVGL